MLASDQSLQTEFDTLFNENFGDEHSCIDLFRSIRWGAGWANGASCPYCGHDKIYDFSDKRTHKCGRCRKRFSIKVGTIFEDTKIPLRKWFMAIWLNTSHKKSIPSTQIARELNVTQKTGWLMLHRLRRAARTPSFRPPAGGVWEEMPFGEALERFIHTKPDEMRASIKRARKKLRLGGRAAPRGGTGARGVDVRRSRKRKGP